MKVLILGVNGFIGSHLSERILATTAWEVTGLDIHVHKITGILNHPRFTFFQGDIRANRDWIREQVKRCDVVLPLVAIANPKVYVQDPLRIFALDFEENLKIVRLCVRYNKRVVFPSTSEVYGMCPDPEFSEDESPLVLGPINKQRWIYSCSKQLMDRVIHVYGVQHGLRYTLFRPFNWIGPKLDEITAAKEGTCRVVTQFLGNILYGLPIKLVDGGAQKRCFTYVDDGIDCLLRILENPGGAADNQIFNIGNPNNHYSVRELADKLRELVAAHPQYRHLAETTQIIDTASGEYYGGGYQDVANRVPSIKKAQTLLGWYPKYDMDTALQKTVDYYLSHGEMGYGQNAGSH